MKSPDEVNEKLDRDLLPPGDQPDLEEGDDELLDRIWRERFPDGPKRENEDSWIEDHGPADLAWAEAGQSTSGKRRWKNTATGEYRYQETKPGTRSAGEDRPGAPPEPASAPATGPTPELPKPPGSWTSPAEIVAHAQKMVAAHEADDHNRKLRNEFNVTRFKRDQAREELGAAIAAGDMAKIAEADEKCRPLTERLKQLKEAGAHESRRSLMLSFQVPPGQQARIRADTGPSTSHATRNWQKASLYLELIIADAAVGPQFVTVRAAKDRAYYDGTGGIFTAASDDPAISAHEFGHHLEKLPWVRERVKTFREKRIDPKDDLPLSKEFPQHGYAPDEVGNPDKMLETFKGSKNLAAYAGKVYEGGMTEIVSMGMEQLYRDPVHFAKTDPEYFGLIIGILQHGEGNGTRS